MKIKNVIVDGKEIQTCGEGYIVNHDEWFEGFVQAQAEVRKMIKHFKEAWDAERGNSKYLHKIFPHGGPQKQGNRLASLLRTKGEH